MIKPTTLLLLLISLLATPVTYAQLDEIVVTGSRINGDDYSQIPAVTVDKRADFLVQQIQLTNDTRDEVSRKKEIYQTIRDLLADAERQPGIALGYGEEFLIPITAKDYEIPLNSDSKRPDTSNTELYVKLAIGPGDDVNKSLATLRAFIKKARVSGRTEIESEDEEALSIVNPERYRFEIITQIANDAKKLQAAIGASCKVDISGLSNRIQWKRSDISQLTLYVPYDVSLVGCQ